MIHMLHTRHIFHVLHVHVLHVAYLTCRAYHAWMCAGCSSAPASEMASPEPIKIPIASMPKTLRTEFMVLANLTCLHLELLGFSLSLRFQLLTELTH